MKLFKFKTPEQKREIKEQKELQKALQKEREINHLRVLERDVLSRKEEKIAPSDACIILKDVNKVYPNHVHAVYDFNIEIKDNEFVVFVGPSGCGKSTTLRMIAGLEEISCGDLYIHSKFANDMPSKDRDMAMVFQNYALYPNMTVFDNMAFSLKMQHYPKEEIKERVLEAAKVLGLTEYLKTKPAALSGGQRQRVALGRAIVRNSKIFLMDEPLSNLDAKLRVAMRSEIVSLHRKVGATTIYVTHDQTEAMTMADRIVVMSKGYVQQIGTPKEIYDKPINKFVATFIGSPAMNIYETVYDNGVIHFDNENYSIELPEEYVEEHDSFYKRELSELKRKVHELEDITYEGKEKDVIRLEMVKQGHIDELKAQINEIEEIIKTKKHSVEFGVRPEDVLTEETSLLVNEKTNVFKKDIDLSELLGNEYFIYVTFNGQKMVAKATANKEINETEKISLCFNLNKIHVFDKTSTKRIF